MVFAVKTGVSVVKTQGEIRGMLAKAGADAFAMFEENGTAMIAFRLAERNIRIKIRVTKKPAANLSETPAEQSRRDQKDRTAWRALNLVIKAKLESVESKIETLEEAFLAHVVMPNGRTVMETISEPLAINYKGGNVPLLPPPT